MACVGEEGAEWVVRVGGQAGEAEPAGDESEGVVGGAMWPVRQGGECVGEGNGFRIDHQVAGQECGGGAACIGQVDVCLA